MIEETVKLHEMIRKLNPKIITIRGDVAYDADENEVKYDRVAVDAKLAEEASA